MGTSYLLHQLFSGLLGTCHDCQGWHTLNGQRWKDLDIPVYLGEKLLVACDLFIGDNFILLHFECTRVNCNKFELLSILEIWNIKKIDFYLIFSHLRTPKCNEHVLLLTSDLLTEKTSFFLAKWRGNVSSFWHSDLLYLKNQVITCNWQNGVESLLFLKYLFLYLHIILLL